MTTFTSDDVNKLKQLVNEGIQVKGEMECNELAVLLFCESKI